MHIISFIHTVSKHNFKWVEQIQTTMFITKRGLVACKIFLNLSILHVIRQITTIKVETFS